MWLLPSRGRPHLVQRLFNAGDFKTPGLLILDLGDSEQYEGIALPEGWEKVILPRMFLSGKLNAGFKYRPEEPWYGILNDDHLPKTEGWDVSLVDALGKMVWPVDNYADRISTPLFDGDLVRELGWIAPPELKHFYIDDVHELLADCLGGRRLEDVTVSHEHVNKGRMKPDRTYLERPDSNADRMAFMKWCRDQWPEIRKRIEC
jgi:hypothetical protein